MGGVELLGDQAVNKLTPCRRWPQPGKGKRTRKHLFQILIPIITFSLVADMDVNRPGTLESISNSIIQSSVLRPLKKVYRAEPMALGITEIGIGILEIAFGVVMAVTEQSHEYSYGSEHITTPYWLGIPYIISGSLSVAVAKKPEISLVKAMLGMHVVSAVAAGVAIVILSISVAHGRYHYKCSYYHSDTTPELCREVVNILYAEMQYACAVLLVFTILEFFLAITTAAFGCASLCRNAYSETTVVIFQSTAQGDPPAVLSPVKEEEEAP